MKSDMEGIVKQMNNNIYLVGFSTRTYRYIVFQENGIPCGYAIITTFARPGRDFIPYMPDALSVATWKKTYFFNFPLIDISEL
jgi:hypothetical protein